MYLRSDPIIRDSPIHIESQRELLSDDPQADPKPIGYLDICVLFLTGSDKLYLAMESSMMTYVFTPSHETGILMADIILDAGSHDTRLGRESSWP